jgi:hypothetical protein
MPLAAPRLAVHWPQVLYKGLKCLAEAVSGEAAMRPKVFTAMACLAAQLPFWGAPCRPALAQTVTAERPQTVARRPPMRLEIPPRPLLYRRCVDWYELQPRPSGTVLYPQMRCWWVRG